jgi:hypothetical protein
MAVNPNENVGVIFKVGEGDYRVRNAASTDTDPVDVKAEEGGEVKWQPYDLPLEFVIYPNTIMQGQACRQATLRVEVPAGANVGTRILCDRGLGPGKTHDVRYNVYVSDDNGVHEAKQAIPIPQAVPSPLDVFGKALSDSVSDSAIAEFLGCVQGCFDELDEDEKERILRFILSLIDNRPKIIVHGV